LELHRRAPDSALGEYHSLRVTHILASEPIRNFDHACRAFLSALFECYTWSITFKVVRRRKGHSAFGRRPAKSHQLRRAVRGQRSLALLGIAFLHIALSQWLETPAFDGSASIGIALVLAAAATFLAGETKGLLIGEPVSPRVEAALP
jgi:hypothetical protein